MLSQPGFDHGRLYDADLRLRRVPGSLQQRGKAAG